MTADVSKKLEDYTVKIYRRQIIWCEIKDTRSMQKTIIQATLKTEMKNSYLRKRSYSTLKEVGIHPEMNIWY